MPHLTEIAQVVKPVNQIKRGDLIAAHNDFKVVDLEKYGDGRLRARGSFETPSFEDFKSYVQSNSSAPVFVDHKNVSAVAVLNFKPEEFDDVSLQGHCDNTATLQLEPTVVWKKISELKGRKLSQRDFAIFLEDWADVVDAIDASDEKIVIAHAINSVRNMKIDTSVSNDTSVTNTSEKRSKFEQVEAKSIGSIPAYLSIVDKAYLGLQDREIKLRLIVNTGDDAPRFELQIVREELLQSEIIEDFKGKVTALLPDHAVRIGKFNSLAK